MKEPLNKRVHVFIDGQNLFKSAEEKFGYTYPNYNPYLLAKELVKEYIDGTLKKIHFYTGIHEKKRNETWYFFWIEKLRMLKNIGVNTHSRKLKYDDTGIGREKGIDVKIALDLVRGYRKDEYDIALIISKDTDLSEAVNEIYDMKNEFKRWVRLECAFIPTRKNKRGLDKTNWIKITKTLYKKCIDNKNYFPPKNNPVTVSK